MRAMETPGTVDPILMWATGVILFTVDVDLLFSLWFPFKPTKQGGNVDPIYSSTNQFMWGITLLINWLVDEHLGSTLLTSDRVDGLKSNQTFCLGWN